MFTFLVSASLRNRLFVLAMAGVLVLLGAYTARQLPVDVFPDLNRPTVTIMTESEGYAPPEVEQLVSAAVDLGPLQPEVAAVDHEVLADRQLGVERVLLGHDAETGADLGPVARRVQPHHPKVTGADRRDAADHPHRRGLARPVRTEEAERLAGGDVEVDVVDRDELAETLRQAAGRDEGGFTLVGPGRGGAGGVEGSLVGRGHDPESYPTAAFDPSRCVGFGDSGTVPTWTVTMPSVMPVQRMSSSPASRMIAAIRSGSG